MVRAAETWRIHPQQGHLVARGYGRLPEFAVFRKLLKTFLSPIEPIWVLNICEDFRISSAYFVNIYRDQTRLFISNGTVCTKMSAGNRPDRACVAVGLSPVRSHCPC